MILSRRVYARMTDSLGRRAAGTATYATAVWTDSTTIALGSTTVLAKATSDASTRSF